MVYAAIDIGGTKTIVALVDERGSIILQKKFPTNVVCWQEHLNFCVDSLCALVEELHIEVQAVQGMGVSLPGIVDVEKGVLIYAPFSKWEKVPVAEYLAEKLNISNVFCENDVNACALGELKFGLGEKYSDFVWITVSTGVGGALISDGKLVRGAQGFAGELGHLKVEYHQPQICPCGQYGCLEAQGSGTALNRLVEALADTDDEFAARLKALDEPPNGAACAKIAGQGYVPAQAVFDRIGTYLGRGISYCINILNPQAVIIGGGVSASLNLLQPAIQKAIGENAFLKMQKVDVICTPLGYEAALIGAASLTMQ